MMQFSAVHTVFAIISIKLNINKKEELLNMLQRPVSVLLINVLTQKFELLSWLVNLESGEAM